MQGKEMVALGHKNTHEDREVNLLEYLKQYNLIFWENSNIICISTVENIKTQVISIFEAVSSKVEHFSHLGSKMLMPFLLGKESSQTS